MRYIVTILLAIVLICAVRAFFDNYVGRKIVDKKIADACSMELRIICNRFYRHAVLSKLDSPTTMQWCDNIFADSKKDVLVCPGGAVNRGIKCTFAINRNVEKYKFKDLPDDLVLFFESNLGWNGVGDKNNVNYSNHSGGLAGIVFVDGDIYHMKKEIVEKLNWD